MRFIASLFIIGVALVPLICSTSSSVGEGFHLPILENLERDVQSLWAKFKKGYDIAFNTAEEDLHRFKIFTEHLKLIIKHNLEHDLGLQTFRLAINKYAALTNEEFRQKFNGYLHHRNASLAHSSVRRLHSTPSSHMTLPLSIDWRNQGLVTPVKDQAQCGSCWAFSTTGALEAQHARATGELVSLSEQQLIDCSTNWGNNGCNGGLMDNAFKYVHDNKGLDNEQSYPYLQQEQRSCKFNRRSIATTCDGYVDIPEGDEAALQQALAVHGPVSVAIDASRPSFQFYTSGVYSDARCSSQNLDHGVLAVGYGVINDPVNGPQEYYLVKNSWSAAWGDKGYIKIARNKNNMCGISSSASYPIVSDSPVQSKMINS